MASFGRQVGWVILVCWLQMSVAQAEGSGSGDARNNLAPGQLQQSVSTVICPFAVSENVYYDCSDARTLQTYFLSTHVIHSVTEAQSPFLVVFVRLLYLSCIRPVGIIC